MMIRFGVAESTTTSGKYASWMASGYFFGRFITSSQWGAYIDKHGRKKGLLWVLFAVATLTLVFGFCESYWLALAVRIFAGFFNGLSIIGKVLTTECCPEDMKTWSISIISTIWSLGMTCGPFIGSFFYGWIEDKPYLSSAIAVAIMGYILMILSYIYIDETLDYQKDHASKKKEHLTVVKHYQLASTESKDGENSTEIELESQKRSKNDSTIDTSDHITEEESETLSLRTKSPVKRHESLAIVNKITKAVKDAWNKFQEIASIPNVVNLIIIFSVNTFYAAVIGEMVPFWAAAKYKDGGLSFDESDIAQIFIYLSVPQLAIQTFLYPYLQKKFGDYRLLCFGHWAHIPFFLILPYGHWFPEGSYFLMKVWIVFWLFIRNLASFINFSSLQRYTNDTVTGNKRGTLNGIQVTFSSMLQSLGPFIGGWVLSWSMENGFDYPLNYHFTFLLMVLVTFYPLYCIYNLIFWDPEKRRLRGEGDIAV